MSWPLTPSNSDAVLNVWQIEVVACKAATTRSWSKRCHILTAALSLSVSTDGSTIFVSPAYICYGYVCCSMVISTHMCSGPCNRVPIFVCKVEKILKGSLEFIPSPSSSVKIQIRGGKGVKAKYFWVLSTNIWIQKVCWQHQEMFCLYPSSKLSRH